MLLEWYSALQISKKSVSSMCTAFFVLVLVSHDVSTLRCESAPARTHLRGDVPYRTVQYVTVSYGSLQCCTVRYCTVLWLSVLHCTLLHCTVLQQASMDSASLKCDEKNSPARYCWWHLRSLCHGIISLFDYKLIHKSLVRCTGDVCRATYYGNWDSASISISIYLFIYPVLIN